MKGNEAFINGTHPSGNAFGLESNRLAAPSICFQGFCSSGGLYQYRFWSTDAITDLNVRELILDARCSFVSKRGAPRVEGLRISGKRGNAGICMTEGVTEDLVDSGSIAMDGPSRTVAG